MAIKIQEDLFFEDKGNYGSMSSPKSTFMDFFPNGPNIILPCKLFKTWDLPPKSKFSTPSLKKVSPPLIFYPIVIITETKSLL